MYVRIYIEFYTVLSISRYRRHIQDSIRDQLILIVTAVLENVKARSRKKYPKFMREQRG